MPKHVIPKQLGFIWVFVPKGLDAFLGEHITTLSDHYLVITNMKSSSEPVLVDEQGHAGLFSSWAKKSNESYTMLSDSPKLVPGSWRNTVAAVPNANKLASAAPAIYAKRSLSLGLETVAIGSALRD